MKKLLLLATLMGVVLLQKYALAMMDGCELKGCTYQGKQIQIPTDWQCFNCKVDGHVLSCDVCGSGPMLTPHIDLSTCKTIKNAYIIGADSSGNAICETSRELPVPGGSYLQSCTGCSAERTKNGKTKLTCGCTTKWGARVSTSLTYDVCQWDITNCNGRLVCGSCKNTP